MIATPYRTKVNRRYSPNPFYDGLSVIILSLPCGKAQNFDNWGWAEKTFARKFALMRYHLRTLREPYPLPAPKSAFRRRSRDNDPRDGAWE